MAKRLSEKEKKEIIQLFNEGKTLDDLAFQFNCTKLTISRNLKKNLGERKFKELNINHKKLNQINKNNERKFSKNEFSIDKNIKNKDFPTRMLEDQEQDNFLATPFIEITPLDLQIDNQPQKDLSSVPISEITLPNIVYMIVHKNIELETKYLKDFPDWQFLAKDELNRKIIEIFIDLKQAKRNCGKEQKVLKVPNSELFKIVAPILKSKGISRIVSQNKLIAL